MAQNDTNNISKTVNMTTKWVLGIGSSLTIMAIAYMFSTVVSNERTLAVIGVGMENVTIAINKNTIAIKDIGEGLTDSRATLAYMVHGVENKVDKTVFEINSLTGQFEKVVSKMDNRGEILHSYETWKSKVDIHIQGCRQSLKECDDKIKIHEHQRITNGGR